MMIDEGLSFSEADEVVDEPVGPQPVCPVVPQPTFVQEHVPKLLAVFVGFHTILLLPVPLLVGPPLTFPVVRPDPRFDPSVPLGLCVPLLASAPFGVWIIFAQFDGRELVADTGELDVALLFWQRLSWQLLNVLSLLG